jgi:TldD protein
MLICLLGALAGASDLSDLLADELTKANEVFAQQEHPAHYAAVTVYDSEEFSIRARAGTLDLSHHSQSRSLDVDLRVGTPALDSTHPLRGFSSLDADDRGRNTVAQDNGFALRQVLVRELDRAYRDGTERMVLLEANQNVKVEEEDSAPDWSAREPVQATETVPPLKVDDGWEQRLVALSAALDDRPEVHDSATSLRAARLQRTFVDTDGGLVIDGRVRVRLSVQATSTAPDGDQVQIYRAIDVHDPSSLPDDNTLDLWAQEVTELLTDLRDAPRGEPYSGPVILRGRATGVFFHEVLGHRVEGHRQKRESEGKTFAELKGESILPDFIDVYDDPTVANLAGHDLNGHYLHDDEGVPASKAVIVEDGKFSGFLMSRSPLANVPDSNGHGRRSSGAPPLARMGNTIIESSEGMSFDRLRAKLVKAVKAQGRDYGYIVDDIDGGFTMTGRVTPNAFNVRANTTWRVFADGRPDQLVRGIDLVGTPLVAFSNLIATDDTPQVFNGMCGAESGWVPVSAIAPSVLFERLEFQLQEKGQERPPLLEKPKRPNDGAAMEDSL